MDEKRFKIINDVWAGLSGSEYVTAIEDTDSPKKTIYFVYNENVQGIVDLLNEQNEEIKNLREALIRCAFDER